MTLLVMEIVNTVRHECFECDFFSLSSNFLHFLFLPVTWMTVRSLKFQRTAWTREQSRSDLNALSCSKFWGKVAMERWDSLVWSSVTRMTVWSPHSCTLLLQFPLWGSTWLEFGNDGFQIIYLICMQLKKWTNCSQYCAKLCSWVFSVGTV